MTDLTHATNAAWWMANISAWKIEGAGPKLHQDFFCLIVSFKANDVPKASYPIIFLVAIGKTDVAIRFSM